MSAQRFFVDHGVIHDRALGVHWHLRDGHHYTVEQECEALNAAEAATATVGGLASGYLARVFMTDQEALSGAAQPAARDELLRRADEITATGWINVERAGELIRDLAAYVRGQPAAAEPKCDCPNDGGHDERCSTLQNHPGESRPAAAEQPVACMKVYGKGYADPPVMLDAAYELPAGDYNLYAATVVAGAGQTEPKR